MFSFGSRLFYDDVDDVQLRQFPPIVTSRGHCLIFREFARFEKVSAIFFVRTEYDPIVNGAFLIGCFIFGFIGRLCNSEMVKCLIDGYVSFDDKFYDGYIKNELRCKRV